MQILTLPLPYMVNNMIMFSRVPVSALIICSAFLLPGSDAAAQQCMLCDTPPARDGAVVKKERPLRIEVATKLSFSKIALASKSAEATVAVGPNGERNIVGNAINLGGYPEAGSVILTGEPGRHVRVDLPANVILRSSAGGEIIISDIRSTLGPAPRLDMGGKLEFSFGGRLFVSGDTSGRFRGRISITADYE